MEANGQCPSVRSYVSNTSCDRKLWLWGMITNELKSPNDLYLEAKN